MKNYFKLFFQVFIAVIFLLQSFFLFAQTRPNSFQDLSEIERRSIMGRDLIFNRKYDEALVYFKKMSEEYPDSLLGSFGQMGVWQAKMFENYDFNFEPEFDQAAQENKKRLEKLLRSKEAPAWDLFLGGAGAGLRAFYAMRKGSPLKALSEGLAARKALDKAHEKEPDFADVYLGLGMYDYWRSVFTNRFKFFPFFPDQRAKGLQEMEKAVKEGRVVGAIAEIGLAYSYFSAGKSDLAIPLLQRLLKKYPGNVVAKNLITEVYLRQGNYTEAHRMMDDVLKNNPEIRIPKIQKGWAYMRENNWEEARRWLGAFLATHPTPEWKSYALADLGRIDLKEGKEAEAYEHFKQAYRACDCNSGALREVQKIRRREGFKWK